MLPSVDVGPPSLAVGNVGLLHFSRCAPKMAPRLCLRVFVGLAVCLSICVCLPTSVCSALSVFGWRHLWATIKRKLGVVVVMLLVGKSAGHSSRRDAIGCHDRFPMPRRGRRCPAGALTVPTWVAAFIVFLQPVREAWCGPGRIGLSY